MAGSVIRIDLRDLGRVARTGRAIADLGDTSPLMQDIAAALVSWTDRRFETETDPDGNPWPKSRRALEQGGQTLTDSGRLRQSVTQRSDARSAEVGTNLVYGGIHQTGGTIRPVNADALVFRVPGGFVRTDRVDIPARPYLGIGADDETELGAIVRDFVDGAFRDDAR